MAFQLAVKRRGAGGTCPCFIRLLVCFHLLFWAATAMVWYFDTRPDHSNSLRDFDDIRIIKDGGLLAPSIDPRLLVDVLGMRWVTSFLVNACFVWSTFTWYSYRSHCCSSNWRLDLERYVVVGFGQQRISQHHRDGNRVGNDGKGPFTDATSHL